VEPGQQVKKGEEIAKVGNTGRSTGPHLHLEIQLYGSAIDPMEYLDKK
jgi:murein DD-endopeptidase MepM/ murein hydrolase activator NlpD